MCVRRTYPGKTAKAKRDDALSHQNIQHATSKVYGAIVDVQNVDMASKISQSVRHACRSSRFCRTHASSYALSFGVAASISHSAFTSAFSRGHFIHAMAPTNKEVAGDYEAANCDARPDLQSCGSAQCERGAFHI